jgi:hypothetical protein
MNKRFVPAMGTYAALAVLAGFTITGSVDSFDGKLRIAVWILLGGLAFKTWIAYKTQK